jgi:hypothetical protein
MQIPLCVMRRRSEALAPANGMATPLLAHRRGRDGKRDCKRVWKKSGDEAPGIVRNLAPRMFFKKFVDFYLQFLIAVI